MSTPSTDGAAHWSGTAVLRRAVTRQRTRLLGGSVLIAAHQLCEVAVPILIGVIVDRAVATGSVTAIVSWIAVLAALFVVLTSVYRVGARLLMAAIAQEGHLLRVELCRRILDPRGMVTEYQAGELLSISSTDAEETAYLLDYVPRMVGAAVATIACGAVLLHIDAPLGVMVLVGVPVVMIGLQLTAPIIARRVEEQQSQIGRATALATDLISGQRPLQGIGAQRNAAHRYRVASRRSLLATLHASRMESAHAGAAGAAGALTAMAVAVAAANFALSGDLTLGQLITVVGLAQFLAEPFTLLATLPSSVAEARASANRVADVLSAPARRSEAPVSDVAAAPGDAALDVIDDAGRLTFRAQHGEMVAVLAPDPRDATTLLDALADRDRGASLTVRVNGRALQDIPYGQRHHAVIVEAHRGDLFSGTLESNLAMPGAEAGADVIAAALTASCAHDVVAQHADGLAHRVIERGASLSGGQRQRWTLARALAADPDVLVLHDPTTAVDAVTEQAIADGIRALRVARRRTTIVFTTSPALLAAADRVIVVDDGQVRGEGTHDDLVDSHHGYRELVHR